MGETFDLATLFDRDEVKRGDGTMQVRHKQELSIMQRHQLDAVIGKINELDAKPEKSVEDANRSSQLLHELSDIVIVNPPDDLEDWECAAVFAFWLARSMQDTPADPPKPRTASSRKSSSSRGSKSSTAATRKSGSTRRRSS